MEAINKIISDSKKLALEEEELRGQVSQLKSELWTEEMNLNSVKKDYESQEGENRSLEQLLESRSQVDPSKPMRETIQISTLLHSFLKTFINKTEPSEQEQKDKLTKLSEVYTKMLVQYEGTPIYQAILREEANERDLADLIKQKRSEIVKLETELKQIQ